MAIRIIPRLDIKGPNLVKGIHLEGLRVLGAPEAFARHYSQAGADELLYMDVVASLYERNSLHDMISRTAAAVFIPITVGGGIRTMDDIKSVLRAGADKVALNTAAVAHPDIIQQASRAFGSSTIVGAIEAVRQPNGRYLASTDNGRQETGLGVFDWACQLEEYGAGELLVTSVDREGTGKGFDLELIRGVASRVSIPVVAHGGAGQADHVREVLVEGQADAVAIGGLFHYGYVAAHGQGDAASDEGNREFLKSGRTFGRLTPVGIQELKLRLQEAGLDVRLDQKDVGDG